MPGRLFVFRRNIQFSGRFIIDRITGEGSLISIGTTGAIAMTQEDEAPLPLEPEELELPLEEDATGAPAPPAAPAVASIKAFGGHQAGHAEVKFRRGLNATGAGATRCRVFHSKLTVAALQHMTGQINEWIDAGEVEIKHVSEVVGIMEGKTLEPNIIVTVWY
jgi:hypothetical protein